MFCDLLDCQDVITVNLFQFLNNLPWGTGARSALVHIVRSPAFSASSGTSSFSSMLEHLIVSSSRKSSVEKECSYVFKFMIA
jgi:hypothetical protein